MERYVADFLESEQVKDNAVTPALDDLFDHGDGELLGDTANNQWWQNYSI
jgi:hypothetical protein